MSQQQSPIFGIRDIAAKFGVAQSTVAQYRYYSNPGGPYENHPFPKQSGTNGKSPYWSADRWPEILEWWNTPRR